MNKNHYVVPIAVLIALIFVVSLFNGCGSENETATAENRSTIEQASTQQHAESGENREATVESAVDAKNSESAMEETSGKPTDEELTATGELYANTSVTMDGQYYLFEDGLAIRESLALHGGTWIGDWTPTANGVTLRFHTFTRTTTGSYEHGAYTVMTWIDPRLDPECIGCISMTVMREVYDSDGSVKTERTSQEFSTTDSIGQQTAARYESASSLRVTRVEATSVLPATETSDAVYTYGPEKMLDDDPITAWNDGTAGDGVGEVLEVAFDRLTFADALMIMPGYFDATYHKSNNRVAEISLSLLKNEEIVFKKSVELEDEMIAQNLPIDRSGFDAIRLKVLGVYRGEQWNDLAIAEIGLIRNGNRVSMHLADDVAIVPSPLGVTIPEPLNQTHLLFVAGSGSDFAIHSIRPDGSEHSKLTEESESAPWLDYSDSNQRIVFSSTRGSDTLSLFTMNTDGSDVRPLLSGAEAGPDGSAIDLHTPRWSPGGDQVAFVGIGEGWPPSLSVGIVEVATGKSVAFPLALEYQVYGIDRGRRPPLSISWSRNPGSGVQYVDVELYRNRGATPAASMVTRTVLRHEAALDATDMEGSEWADMDQNDPMIGVKLSLWRENAPYRYDIRGTEVSLYIMAVDGNTDLFIGTSVNEIEPVYDNDTDVFEPIVVRQ